MPQNFTAIALINIAHAEESRLQDVPAYAGFPNNFPKGSKMSLDLGAGDYQWPKRTLEVLARQGGAKALRTSVGASWVQIVA